MLWRTREQHGSFPVSHARLKCLTLVAIMPTPARPNTLREPRGLGSAPPILSSHIIHTPRLSGGDAPEQHGSFARLSKCRTLVANMRTNPNPGAAEHAAGTARVRACPPILSSHRTHTLRLPSGDARLKNQSTDIRRIGNPEHVETRAAMLLRRRPQLLGPANFSLASRQWGLRGSRVFHPSMQRRPQTRARDQDGQWQTMCSSNRRPCRSITSPVCRQLGQLVPPGAGQTPGKQRSHPPSPDSLMGLDLHRDNFQSWLPESQL